MVDSIIVTPNRKMLLQHRDRNRAIAGQNKWGFIGGRVKKGEEPELAISREVYEEVELVVKNPTLLDENEDAFRSIKYNHYIYYIPFDGEILKLNEGIEYRLCTLKELAGLQLVPWFSRIYTRSLNLLIAQSIL